MKTKRVLKKCSNPECNCKISVSKKRTDGLVFDSPACRIRYLQLHPEEIKKIIGRCSTCGQKLHTSSRGTKKRRGHEGK